MGKHDFNSPKAISNRIKSKGLQRLRFYCQMCEKQCRDENGFKCHSTSEAHLRQMALFAANPDRFMDSFSSSFEKGFMEVLQRRFGTRRVKANYVYNEYIQDKEHVHMNGTMWTTLTDFVKYLGRTGKCVIAEEGVGSDSPAWWITWINRDPEAVKRQEASLKRREREKGDEAREIDEVDLIAARARAEAGLSDNDDYEEGDEEEEEGDDIQDNVNDNHEVSDVDSRNVVESRKGFAPKELKREEGAGPLRISLSAPIAAALPLVGKKRSRWDPEPSASGNLLSSSTAAAAQLFSSTTSSSSFSSSVPVLSQAELLMREEQNLKQRKKEREEEAAVAAAAAAARIVSAATTFSSLPEAAEIHEEWVAPGIVVKVMNSRVGGGKYYKQKGNVVSVEADGFTGIISMNDSGDILKIDQQDLETVVPALGKPVLIVNGKRRGRRATLIALHVEAFSADIELDGGERLMNVPYEHFSKVLGP